MAEGPRIEARWRVAAPLDDVDALVGDPLEFPRWWRASWLDATEDAPGDAGVGRVLSLRARGWSPTTYRLAARCAAWERPSSWRYELHGDLAGTLSATLTAEADETVVALAWQLDAGASRVAAADARWILARGEGALRRKLARGALPDDGGAREDRPVSTSSLPWTLAAVGVAGAIGAVVGLVLRRRPG